MTEHRTEDLLAIGAKTNSPSYAPAQMILDRGEGVYLYDLEDNAYLDFVGGIAVNCLGYQHPALMDALHRQSQRLWHVSNMFYTAEQIELMEALTRKSFADRVFMCNSGAEANEAAMKLARRYQKVVANAPERTTIVTMYKSFHGRTMGALSATGQPKYHKGFEPMLPGFRYATYNDLESVLAQCDETTAAIMVEPVQGEGGIRPGEQAFLEGLRRYCDDHGVVLMFDEVQTGIGRTGHLFAYQGFGVEPDIISLAKGLGGGFPVGAMMATAKIFEGWQRGSHATTFGGNPLGAAVAKTVLDIIERDNLCANVEARGEQLRQGLRDLATRYDVIVDVRGRGLMVGAEVGDVAGELVVAAREQGLLINSAGGNTLRFVPPLIITAEDVEEALRRLELAFEQWQRKRAV